MYRQGIGMLFQRPAGLYKKWGGGKQIKAGMDLYYQYVKRSPASFLTATNLERGGGFM